MRPCWRKAPSRLLACLLDPVLFWTILGSWEDEPIRFDAWQVSFMRDYSRLRAVEKAPQIGFSWACALEATWECLMFLDASYGFVSVDQREASEKVLYARKAYWSLPEIVRSWVPLLGESTEQLLFGDSTRPSRIMSIPATAALRGRSMSVILDECDFYKDGGDAAFRVMLGRIARGGRRGTMGSTCFGQETRLDKVMRAALGTDEGPQVDAAEREMLEAARTISASRFPWSAAENEETLTSIFLAMDTLDAADFAEEYACVRGGLGAVAFPAEMIRDRTHDEDPWPLDDEGRVVVVESPDVPLAAGYDPAKGEGGNPSILSMAVQRERGGPWVQKALHQPVYPAGHPKAGKSLTLPDQQAWLSWHLDTYPQLQVCVDVNGLGSQIGQALEAAHRGRVLKMIPGSKPKDGTSQERGPMATELKRALEAGELLLLHDREQASQFHKTGLGADGSVIQPGNRRRTHFDRFWSTAYLWHGAHGSDRLRSVYASRSLSVA